MIFTKIKKPSIMEYILITGVSTGIGYTSTQHLLEKGFFVFGSVRNQKDAQRLESDFGENFKALIFDVTDGKAINKAVPIVQSIVGNNGLTALVNNAGIVVSGPMQHVPIEKLDHQLNVNVLGVMRVTQSFLPLLGAEKNSAISPGRIIQMSSVSGKITAPFLGPYAASKYALEAISDALRRELFIFGIKVIILEPGPIKTPIWGKAIATDQGDYQDTAYGKILQKRNKSIQKTEAKAIPAEEVAKIVYKSIVIKNPKTRYIIAKKAWTYKIFDKLPDKMVDNSITKNMKKLI